VKLASPMVSRMLHDASRDPEAFWAAAARNVPWLRGWDTVFEDRKPTFRWFVGAETNLSHNALDHHVRDGRGGQAALMYLTERGDRATFTYAQLLHAVTRAAAALRALGVRRGDRITLYMPTSPEAIVLMLACVRIGAIHSVVFAGFGAQALSDRIAASGSRFVFTADVTYRKGKDVPLKAIVDEAVANASESVERVIVWRRSDQPMPTQARDLDWVAFLAGGAGHDSGYVALEANEPAFILATSGTTAKPKLAIHTHGGYQVHIVNMGRWCFGLRPSDVWWATSDIGWIVGHSYSRRSLADRGAGTPPRSERSGFVWNSVGNRRATVT
jgi:acetyl-CoA synthetase